MKRATQMSTDLSGILQLAKEKSLGGELEIAIGGDDHGALAAQLECEWRRELCGGSGDDAAHLAAAREENVAPSNVQQRAGLINRTIHNGVRLRIEIARHEARNEGSRVRCELRGLEHDRAPCRERADEGAERKNAGIVPRAAPKTDLQ